MFNSERLRKLDWYFHIRQVYSDRCDKGNGLEPTAIRGYDPTGISPTITTKSGGDLEPKILMRGRGFNKGGEADIPGTITGSAWEQNNLLDYAGCIRRLTPRECLRLMDVSDGDIDKIQAAGISDTQQYKLAGNSIVKAPMMGIFRNMLKYGLCE